MEKYESIHFLYFTILYIHLHTYINKYMYLHFEIFYIHIYVYMLYM